MTTPFAGNDRFQVLSQLGAGGMGVVYAAHDRVLDMRVALKTLHLPDPAQLIRFKREFRALRDLRHANLVELGELFEDQGSWFFTMELIEGVDFRTYVRLPGGQGFDEARLRGALAGLAAGLAALHRAGKVHCDIKPSNVMVTPAGRVVVLDFGVVTELDHADESRRDRIAGSPLYMAPEQIQGKDIGPAADWYAMGVLLYDALVGEPPFHGLHTAAILSRKVREQPPSPHELVPGLPADLTALCRRLLARAPERRPGEAEILVALGVDKSRVVAAGAPAGASGQKLFVGRKDALATLWQAYRDSRAGSAVSVFVEGESGVGKTSLVERFVDELRAEPGVVVMRGQCHEREFVPYNAFDGIVDGVASYLRSRPWEANFTGAEEMLAPLFHIFPVLRGLPGLYAQDGPVPGDARRLAFFALRRILGWIADQCTLVLSVDDIHWADADSLALLSELLGARRTLPVLFLATARKREDGRPCAAIRVVRGDSRRVALTGLATDEAQELAHRLFERLSAGFVGDIATVVAETGGHPMLMDELVRYMTRHAVASSTMRGEKLEEALRDRILGLDRDAQRLLELVAVAGAPIAKGAIVEAAAMPAETVARWLPMLRGANLVRMSGPEQEVKVTTYHARVRDAIYGHLPEAERRMLHGKLATVLEARGIESLHLAGHFFRAGHMASAARHATAAARKAAESLAFDQAALLYEMALSASEFGSEQDREHSELLTELGMALQSAGRTKEASEVYARAAALAPPDMAYELKRRSAEQLLVGGYLAEGIAAMREVLEAVGLHLPESNKRLMLRVAWSFARLQRSELSWQQPDDATTATPGFKQALTRIDVAWSVGVGLSLADPVRGMLFGLRGTFWALGLGEPFRVARGLSASSVGAAAFGKPDVAARMHEASRRAALEHGSQDALVYADIAQFVHAFFYEQKWRSVVTLWRGFERAWRGSGRGRGFELDFLILFCSWAQNMLGDVNELARFVDMFVSDARRVGNRLLEVSLRASHGLIHLAADDPERASQDVDDAIESWKLDRDVFHLPHIWALLNQADVLLYRGEPFAPSVLEPRLLRLRRSPLRRTRWVLWQEQYLHGRLALARAGWLGAEGKPGEARRELRRARVMAGKLEGSVAPVPRAWGALVRAGIAHVRGERAETVRMLEEAVAGLDATDTMLHAAAARYRLGQIMAGSQGQAHCTEACAAMARLGVTRPERIVRMLAPGF